MNTVSAVTWYDQIVLYLVDWLKFDWNSFQNPVIYNNSPMISIVLV